MKNKSPNITPGRLQNDSWSCGAVTAAVCLELAGVDPLIASELVRNTLAATAMDGTDPRSFEAFFRRLNFRVQAGEMDIGDLVHHTAQSRPVACLITFDGVGHWTTVFHASPRVVAHHCPVRGAVRETAKQFRQEWRDYDRSGANYDGFGVAVLANKRGNK